MEYPKNLLILLGGLFFHIDNADSKETVNDKQVDKSYREQLLSNFIVIDHLTFPTDAVYWNLPDDLFANIPESQTYTERRFRINIKDSETGGPTNNLENAYMYCYEVVLDDPTCGCHGTTPTTVCTVVIGSGGGDTGGTGDTGGGTTPGNPDTGGGGGGGGTGDPNTGTTDGDSNGCGGENHAFYKIVPGCDDGGDEELHPAVLALKGAMLNLGAQFDIFAYEGYLTYNVSIAQKFNTYLLQNNNAQGAAFVMWGLEFLSQNTGTTWAQFENWFITGTLTASQMSEFLLDLNNPDTVKPTKRFKNNAKINAIYNQAKTVSNFKQYLQNFEPTFSVAHLIFDIGTCKYSTSLAETSEPVNYQIQIIFNKDKDWTNMPKIVIADTFMHEMIHAEIFRKLLSLASSNGNIDVNLLKQYLNAHNYPGLFDYYVRYVKGDSSFQHESMAAHYVTIMVNFLKQMYGTKYTDVEYKTVVWMGLKGTTAWNLLPQSEKTLYDNTWNTNYWLWEK